MKRMLQVYKNHKSNHDPLVMVFLCLCILGIIATVWIIHQATKKYEVNENKMRNIENSMKDKMKDFTLKTTLRETLYRCILDCGFLRDTNAHLINTKKRNLSPTIYVITPTFRRPEQIPELIRLGQTLRQVENIHWIVAEDSKDLTPAVKTTIKKMGIPYTILLAPMPEKHVSEPGLKPKGVSNRMAAIEWLRSNNITRGVMYFADDDNTYDLELFEEIRKVKIVGMWPVGLVSHFGLNSPIVKSGKVVGFYVGLIGHRTFPIDMAGFGVNLHYLSKFPNVTMPFWHGYEETVFLAGLNITNDDIEPLADNCTKDNFDVPPAAKKARINNQLRPSVINYIGSLRSYRQGEKTSAHMQEGGMTISQKANILVWHTRTIQSYLAEKTEGRKHYGTNIPFLLDQLQ